MTDNKSKMPDLDELSNIAKTLFKGIKGSIEKIIDDYKKKRDEHVSKAKSTEHAKPAASAHKKAASKAKASVKASAKAKKPAVKKAASKMAASKSRTTPIKHNTAKASQSAGERPSLGQ